MFLDVEEPKIMDDGGMVDDTATPMVHTVDEEEKTHGEETTEEPAA